MRHGDFLIDNPGLRLDDLVTAPIRGKISLRPFGWMGQR